MGSESYEMVKSLQDALREAELAAVKTKECNLDGVLAIARTESQHPSVVAAWRDTAEVAQTADILFPSRKVSALVIEDSVEPQAVGHALMEAAHGGHIHCVRRLREIQRENLSGSLMVSRFNAFAFLKAAEAGRVEVIRELLRPMLSASTAMMGYVVATRWKDKDARSYPFVEQPANIPEKDWIQKLQSTKSMLPSAVPISWAGGWDLHGMPGVNDELHDAIRAVYRTYLLWRTAVIAASHCHVEVFKVLLKQRALENTLLADSFHNTLGPRKAFDQDGKKVISDRARMDTLMYQLVEELSTKKYHDSILFALWGHIQRGGRDSPRPEAGRPRCVAQAQNGLWEMQLEVPLLMMPVEHALQEEEPYRRYKQLTQLFSQRAKVNIQLVSIVEAMPTYLQVTVGIKHVRFKVENSRWDLQSMGHFPSLVSLSVTPVTTEGTGVTMTNSSSNTLYKIGRMERVQVGTGVGDGATRGMSAGLAVSAAVGLTSTMKNKPWRFEQLPLADERGGSFVWTLQAMKGVMFDRSNPMRMADTNSKWRFGKRIPLNPLDELPFSSQGGVIFTGHEFDDTMIWRFPKQMEGTRLRWNIEGQIHSTYTTSRYFETRMASFCGDIEEKLKALELKDKYGNPKGPKVDKGAKGEKGEKGEKAEKGEKGEKVKNSDFVALESDDILSDPEYLEWLEFKKFKSKLQKKNAGDETGAEKKEKKEKKVKTSVLEKGVQLLRKASLKVSGPLGDGDVIDPAMGDGTSIGSEGGSIDGDDLYKEPAIWKQRVEPETGNGNNSTISEESTPKAHPRQEIAGLAVRMRSRELGRTAPAG